MKINEFNTYKEQYLSHSRPSTSVSCCYYYNVITTMLKRNNIRRKYVQKIPITAFGWQDYGRFLGGGGFLLHFCTSKFFIKCMSSLTGVAHLVGPHPGKWMIASLIPSQGTCLGCGFSPWSGHVQEATDTCFSPSLLPSLPISVKINKCQIVVSQGGANYK